MNCRILSNLYVKADGELPCDDDVGESVVLGKVSVDQGWSIHAHLNSSRYHHLRTSFRENREPWPDVCPKCPLLRPYEDMRDELVRHRIERIQVEPSLACALRCPSCSQPYQIAHRAKPHIMSLEVFRRLLESCAEHRYEIGEIEYCGQGEPLSHPRFADFVRTAREICPETWQRVITNGNYDYATKLEGEFIDEIMVSCDGVFQENYERYRRNGLVTTALKFMRDAAAPTQARVPAVVWKYVVFEFNDSDEELSAAQAWAVHAHIGKIVLVITETEFKSMKYTVDNRTDLLLRVPIATVDVVPRFRRDRPLKWFAEPVEFENIYQGQGQATLCHVDHMHLFSGNIMTLNGWGVTRDARDSIADMTVFEDGELIGKPLLGLSRPDIFHAYPELCNRWAGFILSARRGHDLYRHSRIDVRVRTTSGAEDHYAFAPKPSRQSGQLISYWDAAERNAVEARSSRETAVRYAAEASSYREAAERYATLSASLAAELAIMKSSRSWRFTRPLRELRRIAKSGFGRRDEGSSAPPQL